MRDLVTSAGNGLGTTTTADLTGATAGAIVVSVDGIPETGDGQPPTAHGAVGSQHYVQWVGTDLAVFDKAGGLVLERFPAASLWTAFGGACEHENSGQGTILFDHLADRWVFTQAAFPSYPSGGFQLCVAVSTTADPTGSYYRHSFPVSQTKLASAGRLGLWPSGYYLTVRQSDPSTNPKWSGVGLIVLDRQALLAGRTAPLLYMDMFATHPDLHGLLPADLDGPSGSPAAPALLVDVDDVDDDPRASASRDRIRIWRFQPNWAKPHASQLAGPTPIRLDGLNSSTCKPKRSCGAQVSETQFSPPVRRLPIRAQYRQFATHDALFLAHTVDAGGEPVGIRWYEIGNPGQKPVIRRQGTYTPDPGHRWAGSIASNDSGHLVLVFTGGPPGLPPSVRSVSLDPGVGQGSPPAAEIELLPGSAGPDVATPGSWGGEAALHVDPVDDCTLWYTQEYPAASTRPRWRTRVIEFRVPCQESPSPDEIDLATAVNRIGLATAVNGIDLGIVVQRGPNPVTVGQNVTYTAAITNLGIGTATSVTVKHTMLTGLSLVSLSVSQGYCTANLAVDCQLGSLAPGAAAQVRVVAKTTVVGSISTTTSVSAQEPDIQPLNNQRTVVTTVEASTSPSPDPDSTTSPPPAPAPGPVPPGSTALGTLAAAMAPGTWAELVTIGAQEAWTSTGSSKITNGFSEDLLWDPITRTATFLGSDHLACVKVPRYDEATNTWTLLPRPPWTPQPTDPTKPTVCTTTMHDYDEGALNPATGHLYHRKWGMPREFYRRDPATGAWTLLPLLTLFTYSQCCGATEWVPELGLVHAQGGEAPCSDPAGQCGGVYRFRETTQTWDRLAAPIYGMRYQNFLEYSPVHRVSIFGQRTSVHRLNADGTVTTLPPSPVHLDTYHSAVTTDPVGGDFLLFSDGVAGGEKHGYSLNPLTGVYTPIPNMDTAPIWGPSTSSLFPVLAASIPAHRVVLFVRASLNGTKVYLYKPVTAVTGPVPPSSEFASRCAAPGVVRCEGFETAQPPNAIQPGRTTPQLDSAVKASGTQSLRFTIPSLSGANAGGSFNMNFTPGSAPFGQGPYPVQFGAGDEFYIQWRMRFSPDFLTTTYRATDGGTTGPKLLMVGTGDRPGVPAYSCSDLEIVTMTRSFRVSSTGQPIPPFPQMYHSCGRKDGQYEGLTEPVKRLGMSTPDYRLQNAIRDPAAPTDVSRNCLWTASSVPPCVGLKPDQWMTFQLRVKVGTWYANTRQYKHDSEIQLWVAEAGQPARLVMDYRPAADPACGPAYPTTSVPPCQTGYDLWGDGIQKYGKLWLTPFMTGKDSTQVHPEAYVWVDDVIVSRSRIADPGPVTP